MAFPDLSGLPPVPSLHAQSVEDTHADHVDVIASAITGAPRSMQKRIGPSEIGHPCTRRIAYRVAGVEAVNDGASWRPTVGTAVHSWLADAFAQANRDADAARYLIELSVEVGNGITGTVDLYDRAAALVNDWKVVSPTALKKYSVNGPGPQYRTQIHLYARGLANRGLAVKTVAITFLPNSGELHEAVFWSEPYDEQVATAALERLATVQSLTDAAGAAAAPLMPIDGAAPNWCRYCPFYLPASTDLTAACPGAVKHAAKPAA
jgi:hypothetical protein